jgi:hypothetical protein
MSHERQPLFLQGQHYAKSWTDREVVEEPVQEGERGATETPPGSQNADEVDDPTVKLEEPAAIHDADDEDADSLGMSDPAQRASTPSAVNPARGTSPFVTLAQALPKELQQIARDDNQLAEESQNPQPLPAEGSRFAEDEMRWRIRSDTLRRRDVAIGISALAKPSSSTSLERRGDSQTCGCRWRVGLTDYWNG